MAVEAAEAANAKKLQPKLRMVLNATDDVNAVRAEHAAALTSTMEPEEAPLLRGDDAVPGKKTEVTGKKGKLMGRVASHAAVNVFARLSEASETGIGLLEERKQEDTHVVRKLDMATATIGLDELKRIQEEGAPGLSISRWVNR